MRVFFAYRRLKWGKAIDGETIDVNNSWILDYDKKIINQLDIQEL